MADKSAAMIAFDGQDGQVQAYLVRPAAGEPRPAVIVIHEIYGLGDHTKDVANRFADQGYVALAPHLFSRPGLAEVLTPANISAAMRLTASIPREKMGDPAAVQQALTDLPPEDREAAQKAAALIFGGMPRDLLTQDLVRAVEYLNGQDFVIRGKVASVGFCFGGGMSLNLACHAGLAACVIFYGENPNPLDLVAKIPCPVLGLYGGEDRRIDQDLDKLVRAMVEYHKDFEMRLYPGAGHAFFNDTRPQVYREAAAKDAWERVLRFYERTLLGTAD